MDEEDPLPNWQEGAVLLVDKPLGWTSFDVVNKLRYQIKKSLNIKKIKVGHAGTLDPLATGLLIICTGKMTKQIDEFQGLDKSYEGTLQLGLSTPSFDAETKPDETYPTKHLTDAMLQNATQQFIGDIEQYPPVFSAIKVDGQPMYKAARKGKEIEIKPRPVSIRDFQLTKIELPNVDFHVTCSKGTYIRSLANDFGKAVNSGAYLTRLVRTEIGEFKLEHAWNLEKLVAVINPQS